MLRCGHTIGETDITLGEGRLCRKNGSSCCSSGGDCSFRRFSAGGAVGTDRLDRYAVPRSPSRRRLAAGVVSPLGQLYRLSQRRDLDAELEVEAVAADGLLIGSVGVDPRPLR